MKKIFLAIILLSCSSICLCQIKCSRISCNDTIPYTQTGDSLNAQLAFTPTSVIWNLKSGVGTIANPNALNTVITGLKPGTTNTITFIAIGSGQVYTALETITVLPAPITQRKAVKIDLILRIITYDDGTISAF